MRSSVHLLSINTVRRLSFVEEGFLLKYSKLKLSKMENLRLKLEQNIFSSWFEKGSESLIVIQFLIVLGQSTSYSNCRNSFSTIYKNLSLIKLLTQRLLLLFSLWNLSLNLLNKILSQNSSIFFCVIIILKT